MTNVLFLIGILAMMLRYSIPLTILSCALILILTLLSRLLIPLIAKNRKRWSKWRKI
ncbi:MAG: hypothetical protein SOX70_06015 [Peptoniphilaceae bacterium]|nr:hypothetical protein [Peptoniphilaceae bacterium]